MNINSLAKILIVGSVFFIDNILQYEQSET